MHSMPARRIKASCADMVQSTSVSSEGRRRRMSRAGFGDVVVERRFRDPHHPADLADRVLLLGIELDHELPLGRLQNLWTPTLAPPRASGVQSGLGSLVHQV